MIGQLRHRIGIYVPQSVPDGLGGQSTSWVLHGAEWAHLTSLTSQQAFENGRAAITQRYRIVIRYRADFPERARIVWGDKTLSAMAASDPDGRREQLHIIAEEEQQ